MVECASSYLRLGFLTSYWHASAGSAVVQGVLSGRKPLAIGGGVGGQL